MYGRKGGTISDDVSADMVVVMVVIVRKDGKGSE